MTKLVFALELALVFTVVNNRVYQFPCNALQGNLDPTLPTTVELSSGFSDINVDELPDR